MAGRCRGAGRRAEEGKGFRGSGLAAHLRDRAPGRFLHPCRRPARPLAAGRHLADPHPGTAARPAPVLRQARGVTPTTIGDELAHKAAPHLDALLEIAESGLDEASSLRTLHLAGPPEFIAERALPALSELSGEDGQGLALRASLATAEEALEGLAAGLHDLVISTARPRGALLTATPLCDEELVLVAAPRWAKQIGAGTRGGGDMAVLEQVPVIEVHESLPFVARYWSSVFDLCPSRPRNGHRPRPARGSRLRGRGCRAGGTAPLSGRGRTGAR
ncbi:hypothetical protein SFUMM280S_07905 [Streptomyces fumanus]